MSVRTREVPFGAGQNSIQILVLKIGIVGQDLRVAQASGIELEDVGYADPHAMDAGLPPALKWIGGDPLAHRRKLGLISSAAAALKEALIKAFTALEDSSQSRS